MRISRGDFGRPVGRGLVNDDQFVGKRQRRKTATDECLSIERNDKYAELRPRKMIVRGGPDILH